MHLIISFLKFLPTTLTPSHDPLIDKVNNGLKNSKLLVNEPYVLAEKGNVLRHGLQFQLPIARPAILACCPCVGKRCRHVVCPVCWFMIVDAPNSRGITPWR